MSDFTYEDALLERYGPWETLAAGYGTPRRKRRGPSPTPKPAPIVKVRQGHPPWCPACGDGADVCMRHGTFWKRKG